MEGAHAMSLTAGQVDEYRNRGYLIFDGLLAGDALQRSLRVLRQLVERSRSQEKPDAHWSLALDAEGKPTPGRLHKIQGVCVVEQQVLDLAREPEILDRV